MTARRRRKLDPAAEEEWFSRQFRNWKPGKSINPYTGNAELEGKRKKGKHGST